MFGVCDRAVWREHTVGAGSPICVGGWIWGNGPALLLDHLLAADQDAPSGPMPRRLVHLALAACKAAIKARTGVTKQEAGALLVQLWECRNPYTCPHGRPTMIELSIAELDRRFGRR